MYVERRSRVTRGTLWRVSQPAGSSVLPDGCMDLLWLEDRLVVAGPDTRPQLSAEPNGSEPTEVVGLRFDPGVAPGLLGIPAQAVRDVRVPLSELWPPGRVRRWTERIRRDGPGVVLEEWALDQQASTDHRAEMSRIVRLCDLGRPGGVIAREIGWSERTLHRRCLDAFGYGSKTLSRVLRFQRAATLLRAGERPADVAVRAGYADQAHLTREVSALAGVSPGRLR